MDSKRSKHFFTCFSCISLFLLRQKHVRNYLWCVFRQAGSWWPNWWQLPQTALSTPPKADIEELMQSDLSDSVNTSLSLCIISSTCRTLLSTTINPLTLENSPRGFGNDSVGEFVQPRKKGLSLGPRQVYLITYSQADVLKFKIENNSQSFFMKNFTGKMK